MSEIRHVRPEDLVEADPTPGIRRRRAVASDRIWAGLAHTGPGTVSGWHHHGDYETSLYVVSGVFRLEYGPAGARVGEARPGDFVHVPRGAIHREGNPSDAEATLVVVRAGRGVPTVNVDGPEPGPG